MSLKRSIRNLSLGLSLLGAFLVSAPMPAFCKEEHPAMHEASDALHAAQSSVNPIEDLHKARRSLETARANKMGDRVDAIKLVDKAIAALKANDRIGANKFIEEAILQIEKGVELHPRDGKHK